MPSKNPLADALELWPGPIEELAEAVGVQRNTLYVYASGRRTPPEKVLQKVAQLLEQRTAIQARRAKGVAAALRTQAKAAR